MAGKVYLAQYFDHMFYFHTPHWGLNGIVNQIKSYSEEEKKECITSVRFDDPVHSALLHPIKYYYVYGRSNHCNLLYQQFWNEILQFHESQRLQFRIYCQNTLGLDFTLDSLVEYMKTNDWPEYFLEVVELEVNLKDLYRYKVLEQPFEEILENREIIEDKIFAIKCRIIDLTVRQWDVSEKIKALYSDIEILSTKIEETQNEQQYSRFIFVS